MRGVSKDGRYSPVAHPSRRAQGRAPQDEDSVRRAISKTVG